MRVVGREVRKSLLLRQVFSEDVWIGQMRNCTEKVFLLNKCWLWSNKVDLSGAKIKI